jgi:hypothetical protein
MLPIFRALTYMASGGMAHTLFQDHLAPTPPRLPKPQYLAAAGTAVVLGAWWWQGSRVTTGQFYQACGILQTQVGNVASTLVSIKDSVMVRFGIVERKLDTLDETAQEIRTNVETVQESLEEVRTRVQNIDANTQFSSSLLGKLLLPQAPKAAWWLSV